MPLSLDPTQAPGGPTGPAQPRPVAQKFPPRPGRFARTAPYPSRTCVYEDSRWTMNDECPSSLLSMLRRVGRPTSFY